MRDVRTAGAIGVVVALAAALIAVLVVSDGGAREPAPSVADAAAADTEPAAAEASDGDIPYPDTSGEDFDRIFREISAFRDWLYANPDPDLLRALFDPECDCYEATKQHFTGLEREDLRYADDETLVHEVRMTSQDESRVRLEALLESPQVRLLDANGKVVEQGKGPPPTWFNFELTRERGSWRISDVEPVHRDA